MASVQQRKGTTTRSTSASARGPIPPLHIQDKRIHGWRQAHHETNAGCGGRGRKNQLQSADVSTSDSDTRLLALPAGSIAHETTSMLMKQMESEATKRTEAPPTLIGTQVQSNAGPHPDPYAAYAMAKVTATTTSPHGARRSLRQNQPPASAHEHEVRHPDNCLTGVESINSTVYL